MPKKLTLPLTVLPDFASSVATAAGGVAISMLEQPASTAAASVLRTNLLQDFMLVSRYEFPSTDAAGKFIWDDREGAETFPLCSKKMLIA